MKIIYKAEDGTEFEKESNCKEYEESQMQIEIKKNELVEIAHNFDPYMGFCEEQANFIIKNIQKINEILGYKVDEVKDESEVVFVASDGITYKTAPETRSCDGCAFFPSEHTIDCSNSDGVMCCGDHDIIWIKK